MGQWSVSRWRWRWYEFVPETVLALALLGFLIDETDAATSALKSGRAVAMSVLVAVVWLALRVGMARLVAPVAARMAVAAVGAVAVFSIVVLPAYRSDTVVEVFPTAMPAAGAPSASVAPAPAKLATAALRGIDHRAEGTVSLYKRADGLVFVGLEDVNIQPGPDYDVYLVPGGDKRGKDGGVKLDDLRGNKGTQFYDVPASVSVGGKGEWTVLVWCQTFAVPIANAGLTVL